MPPAHWILEQSDKDGGCGCGGESEKMRGRQRAKIRRRKHGFEDIAPSPPTFALASLN